MNRAWWRTLVVAAILLLWTGPAMAMYHPALGRWLQRDQAGDVDGMSLYQYGRSNPCARGDPSGRVVIGVAGWMLKGTSELQGILQRAVNDINADAEMRKQIRGGEGESLEMTIGCVGWDEGKIIRLLEEYRKRKDEGLMAVDGMDCWKEEVVLVGYSDGATAIWRLFGNGRIQGALKSREPRVWANLGDDQHKVAFVGMVDLVRTVYWGWDSMAEPPRVKKPLPLEDDGVILQGSNYYQEDPGGWKGTPGFTQEGPSDPINHPRFSNMPVPNASHAGSVLPDRPAILNTDAVRDGLVRGIKGAYMKALNAGS